VLPPWHPSHPGVSVQRPVNEQSPGMATLGIHAGHPPRHPDSPVVPSIVRSSTFVGGEGEGRDLLYSRYGNNPTQRLLGEKVAALEGAEAGLGLASGMAAISMALLSLLRAGDHVVASRHLYGATRQLLEEELPNRGIHTTFIDPESRGGWESALLPETRLLYLELPTNPTLRVFDPRIPGSLAEERGLELVVDATFATPVNLRPLELGATLVVHSATKYMGGHSDLVAGVVAGSQARIGAVTRMMRLYGPSLDPGVAWLLDRGLRTLPLRMARHNRSALELARWFHDQPEVEGVLHPGLPHHPDHDLSRELMPGGSGGIFSLVLAGGGPAASAFCAALEVGVQAPSLGGVETLVSQPRFTSHRHLSAEDRLCGGIPEGLVRISVGLEEVEDLRGDFRRGLAAAAAAKETSRA